MTGFPVGGPLGGKVPSWFPEQFRKQAETSGEGDPAARGEAAGDTVIDISDVPELRGGVLNVGLVPDYAPLAFEADGGRALQGLDVDLASALAERLGVQVKFQATEFQKVIRDLKGGRFDVILSALTITEDRAREIDFVQYLATPTMGTGILVPRGNPYRIQRLEDLCGRKVSVQAGTVQADEASSVTCANRKSKINVNACRTHWEALEQLLKGRVDALLADAAVVKFEAARADGVLDVAPSPFRYAPYGMGLRKESQQLRRVLERALKAVKDDGTYNKLLEKWGL